jgi:hypothetical protein
MPFFTHSCDDNVGKLSGIQVSHGWRVSKSVCERLRSSLSASLAQSLNHVMGDLPGSLPRPHPSPFFLLCCI